MLSYTEIIPPTILPWVVTLARYWIMLLCLCVPGHIVAQQTTTAVGDSASSRASDIQVVEGDILRWRSTGRRALALLGSMPTWRDGIVPYRIDADLPDASVQTVKTAIEHWNQVSGISLLPVSEVLESDPGLSAFHLDSILFEPGDGCASWVGRRGGEQEVWVSPSCTVGSLMHEIGHVLGLEHEHTRPDRDRYITIHWDNIAPEKRHNFDISSSGSRVYGDYDYGSIMHYGPYNFALGSSTTITPIYAPQSAIGQRRSPSAGDLAAVAELYATDLSINTQHYELEEGAETSVTVSNNLAQGAHNLEVNVSVDFSYLMAHSDNGWSCRARIAGLITCYLDRLAATSRSVLTLRFREALDVPEVRATVRSKTPDAQLQNNSDSSGDLPELAAAQLQDDFQTATFGGAALPIWLLLALLWLQRKTSSWVYRQSSDRVEGGICR